MACVTDPQQLKSMGMFISSLSQALDSLPESSTAQELNPLMRELRADGLRRALELCAGEDRRAFLEALTANVQKFPPHEQKSLARILPVEISAETRQLAIADVNSAEVSRLAPTMPQMQSAPLNAGVPGVVAAAPCPALLPPGANLHAVVPGGLAPMLPQLGMMPGQAPPLMQQHAGGFQMAPGGMPATMPSMLPPALATAVPQPLPQAVKFGLDDDEL
mmetsp:Transcript_62166/g.115362  ORF Transcript_62166/g.115362 Transcript_62166/m.115362 type:complete len:219 (-) Transcript_62166:115-771(-)